MIALAIRIRLDTTASANSGSLGQLARRIFAPFRVAISIIIALQFVQSRFLPFNAPQVEVELGE
jgi:hypothetical protein